MEKKKHKEAVNKAYKLDPRQPYCAVVDWSLPANEHRFFLYDTHSGKLEYSWFTSHGRNTGSLKKAERFSNVPESHQSSLGLMVCSETYSGKFGYSCRLDGISPGTNDNVRSRAIVLHKAGYVTESFINTHGNPGRSWGCITLDPRNYKEIIDKLKNGGLILNIT